jgi:hypothetical protein
LADPIGLVFATRWSIADFAGLPEMVVEPLHEGDARTLLSAALRSPGSPRLALDSPSASPVFSTGCSGRSRFVDYEVLGRRAQRRRAFDLDASGCENARR